jgi:hypothetical protein
MFILGTNIYHAQLLGSTHHYLVRTTFVSCTNIPHKLQCFSASCQHSHAPTHTQYSMCISNPSPCRRQYSTRTHCAPLILLYAVFIFNAHSLCITNIQCACPTHYYYVCTHQLCMVSIFIMHVMHSHITCAPPFLYPTIPIFSAYTPHIDILCAP